MEPIVDSFPDTPRADNHWALKAIHDQLVGLRKDIRALAPPPPWMQTFEVEQ